METRGQEITERKYSEESIRSTLSKLTNILFPHFLHWLIEVKPARIRITCKNYINPWIPYVTILARI
jgi:hypothetical protein